MTDPRAQELEPDEMSDVRRSDTDAGIRDLAGRQHGVVAARQLLAAGVPRHAIDFRVERGRLTRLYKGVYRTGAVGAAREPEMAAVLACGESAVLSHRDAAVLPQILPPQADRVGVEVSVRNAFRCPGAGVRAHRVSDLEDCDITVMDGIPVTTPERTILDLGASVTPREVEQALAEAERRGLVDRQRLISRLAQCPRRAGSRVLRAILARGAGPAFLRSRAEELFDDLRRKGRITAPETNVRLEGFEVDALWRNARLVVEIDGAAYHSSGRAFERDRERDAVLAAAGFRVMRLTWRQLTKEREAVLVRLGQALGRSPGC
jgi:very-short-patch-repair endonuclease/predicted transcriptional regulator of viral defense system